MLTRNLSFLYNQLTEEKITLDSNEPPADSFFFRVFDKNISIAERVLNTPFLQEMKKNVLPPLNFGVMNVQDAYYCYCAENSYKRLLNGIKVSDELTQEMLELVQHNYKGYVEYNKVFLDIWHIPAATSVKPTKVFQDYAEHEFQTASNYDPIYTLVAMLPCYYLWYWFSSKLSPDMSSDNLYIDWVEGSLSARSAYRIGNFIDKWQKQNQPFDERLAEKIYAASMNYELQIFTEAYQPDAKQLTRGGI